MTKSVCTHLEELLPHPKTGERDRPQIATQYRFDMEKAMSHQEFKALTPSLSYEAIDAFENRLRGFGLQQHEINILVDKFCYNCTFEEMAFDLTTNISSIYRIYKQAIGKLRSAGYELE